MCTSFINPFMDLNKLLAVEVFALMRKSKNLVLLEVKMSLVSMPDPVGVL